MHAFLVVTVQINKQCNHDPRGNGKASGCSCMGVVGDGKYKPFWVFFSFVLNPSATFEVLKGKGYWRRSRVNFICS